MVGRFHGNRDIRDPPIDGVLRIGQRFIGVDDLAVSLVRHEVICPVLRDKASEALAHIQHFKLCPQIHKAVRRRSAGQADNPVNLWPYLHQRLEALGFMIFEGRQLIDNHHIEVKGKAGLVNKPLQVLTVDNRDICFLHEGGFSLLRCPDCDRIG